MPDEGKKMLRDNKFINQSQSVIVMLMIFEESTFVSLCGVNEQYVRERCESWTEQISDKMFQNIVCPKFTLDKQEILPQSMLFWFDVDLLSQNTLTSAHCSARAEICENANYSCSNNLCFHENECQRVVTHLSTFSQRSHLCAFICPNRTQIQTQ